MKLKIEYSELIPIEKKEGVLYVSLKYGTATHLCVCGCKNLVVIPFNNPHYGWSYKEENGNVSFSPSIGNYSFPCKSHYWIRHNEIVWA